MNLRINWLIKNSHVFCCENAALLSQFIQKRDNELIAVSKNLQELADECNDITIHNSLIKLKTKIELIITKE